MRDRQNNELYQIRVRYPFSHSAIEIASFQTKPAFAGFRNKGGENPPLRSARIWYYCLRVKFELCNQSSLRSKALLRSRFFREVRAKHLDMRFLILRSILSPKCFWPTREFDLILGTIEWGKKIDPMPINL